MKKITAFILLFAMLSMAAISVGAETQERDTFYLDEDKSIVIEVSWDAEKPAVVFIDPDGKEYDPLKAQEGTVTAGNDANMTLYYVIENAARGQWRVRYDKGKNEKIEVELHDYKKGLFIESFKLGAVDGYRLPVTFKVDGEEGVYYNYRISAMVDRTGGEKELADGNARVGDEKEVKVALSSLSSYDSYILKLYVWYDDNGTDIFDFMFSSPFEFENKETDGKAVDFKMSVYPEESLLYVSFGELGWDVDGMIVAVFEDGAKEPVSFDNYERDKDEVCLSYDPAAKEVAVEVSYTVNGVNTAPVRKSAYLSDMAISVPEGKAFNSVNLPMTYKGLEKQLCAVSVNGYVTELVLDGDGQANITLGDDWNDLRIEYLDKNGVTWLVEKEIFVDRIAPVLNMSQNYDGMAVSEKKLTVSGSCLDVATLTVNGKETEIEKDGSFSTSVKLSKGENIISVVATDALGNESRYTAAVYSGIIISDNKDDGSAHGKLLESLISSDNFWVLIVFGGVCILVVLYAVIFWRDGEKKKEKSAEKKPKKEKKEKGAKMDKEEEK